MTNVTIKYKTERPLITNETVKYKYSVRLSLT